MKLLHVHRVWALGAGLSLMLSSVAGASGANGKGIAPGHGRLIDAVFSPDGRSVVLRSHAGENDTIYISNIDGSDLRTLNRRVGEHVLFAVSPILR
jgi:hypothetical protein